MGLGRGSGEGVEKCYLRKATTREKLRGQTVPCLRGRATPPTPCGLGIYFFSNYKKKKALGTPPQQYPRAWPGFGRETSADREVFGFCCGRRVVVRAPPGPGDFVRFCKGGKKKKGGGWRIVREGPLFF